jgi:hypothetical protein
VDLVDLESSGREEIRGQENCSMTYFGDAGVLLAAFTTLAGTGVGWVLRALLSARAQEDEAALREEWSLVREEVRTLQVSLGAALERVVVREREIAELQSLLSLAEQERDSLRAGEPQLQGQ